MLSIALYLKRTAHSAERAFYFRSWTIFLNVFLHLENKNHQQWYQMHKNLHKVFAIVICTDSVWSVQSGWPLDTSSEYLVWEYLIFKMKISITAMDK